MRNWLTLAIVVIGCGSSGAGDDLFGTPSPGSGGSAAAGGAGSAGTSGAANGGTGTAGTGGGAAGTSQGGSAANAGTSGAGNGTAGTGGTAAGGEGGVPVNDGGASGAGGANDAGAGAGGTGSCEPNGVELCDGLDNDGCNGVDDGDPCPTDCYGFADAEDHGYMICLPEVDVEAADAQAFCQAHDPSFNLVRIDSDAENAFLLDSVASVEDSYVILWLGATDTEDEGEWFWLDGTQFFQGEGGDGMTVNDGYENWGDNQPNDNDAPPGEDCAVMKVNDDEDGMWNDFSCELEAAFICEGP